jgi:hypothetical protein
MLPFDPHDLKHTLAQLPLSSQVDALIVVIGTLSTALADQEQRLRALEQRATPPELQPLFERQQQFEQRIDAQLASHRLTIDGALATTRQMGRDVAVALALADDGIGVP